MQVMKPLMGLGVIFLVLAGFWFVSSQVYMFELGPAYTGPSVSQNLGERIMLIFGSSGQGMTVNGLQIFLLGIVGSAGLGGTVVLACGGVACVLGSALRDRPKQSYESNNGNRKCN
ncbi:MAG: hypothetical protein ACE5KO_04500 [Candidatus Bathyarchaeia archaeon]